jgi:hypothetical protein
MTTHLTKVAAVVAVAWLASACNTQPTAPAAPGAQYEGATVPGAQSATGGFMRINIATGQAVITWDGTAALTVIPDATLPAGQYHLYVWVQPVPGGNVTWNAVRMDAVSGRIWGLNGGGTTAFSWAESTAPKL